MTATIPSATSIVPSPWPVCHIARYIDPSGAKDEHGNPAMLAKPAVIRYVMSIAQLGRHTTTREIISPDVLLRTETTLIMAVADPENYAPEDLVLIHPELDASGAYVSPSGLAYWVDGDPAEGRQGPWPALLAIFGGVIKLRRVT